MTNSRPNDFALPIADGDATLLNQPAEKLRNGAEQRDRKWRVYLNEYNILMDNVAYLPLVSGLLKAYAMRSDAVNANYEFMPFLFRRGPVEPLVEQHQRPDLAAFSVSMWNEQLSLKLARRVKDKYPRCIIVVGGAQVPHHAEQYLQKYAFIDIAVRGPGEQPFAALLERLVESDELSGINALTWREKSGRILRNEKETELPKNLDELPSPYLDGLYDDLFDKNCDPRGDLQFQAIIETNRGCPFPCSFCYWGQGGLNRKYRFHSIERVADEIEWFAKHKIRYVFNADSNFGMHHQDQLVAEALAAAKQRYGYPEKFRTCFGKNTDDRIFDIATYLHNQGLGKGITLARQSNDEQVLKNIKRKNIKMSTYQNLQVRFNESDVPVYSELILGLPGETYQTWTDGIEHMLQSGLKNQLFIYQCQVLPNTDLGDPEYQNKFGIQVKRIELAEIHGGIRPKDLTTEYEDIIVATNSMPVEQWRQMSKLSWTLMVMHGLKLGFFLMTYLADRYGIRYTDFLGHLSHNEFNPNVAPLLLDENNHFDRHVDNMLNGRERAVVMREYGNLYWDIEEASLLRISEHIENYYSQLQNVTKTYLAKQAIDFDELELEEVFIYQRMRMPSLTTTHISEHAFSTNLPEYFDLRLGPHAIPLAKANQTMNIEPKDFGDDKPRYARETILWGRKSGSMLTKYKWRGEPTRRPVAA